MTFAILSTSLKAITAFLVYFTFRAKSKKTIATLLIAIATTIFISTYYHSLAKDILSTVDSKISYYLTKGDSARYESYRVMFESLGKPNLIGEGLGSFGGPASIYYNSPKYNEYNFNWYALEEKLSTTDTLYPHLFVELGLFGAILYLSIIFNYNQYHKTRMWAVVFISFLIDNIASFSMLSAPYFFTAALLMTAFSQQTRNDYAITNN
jgi:hypothetical protein